MGGLLFSELDAAELRTLLESTQARLNHRGPDDWQDECRRIEQRSPVRLDNWNRHWCLFTLEDFLERNQIAGGQLAAAA